MKKLVVYFLFLLPIPLLASEINDKMWSKQDFETHFLPNLLINGKFELNFDGPVADPRNPGWNQFEKCWSVSKKDSKGIKKVEGSAGIQLQKSSFPVEIFGTSLSFKDNFKQMDNMKVIVDGLFEKPSVIAKLGYCKDTCVESEIPLRLEDNRLVAELGDLLKGAQISSFSLVVLGGVGSISSVVLGSGSGVEDFTERDLSSSEYCFKPPFNLGESSWFGPFVLLVLSFVGTALLVFLVKRSDWFLATLVSVYLSFSFFGIWILYFGLSEYRLAQGIFDRNRILSLGAINIFVLGVVVGVWLLLRSRVSSRREGKISFPIRWGAVFYVGIVLVLLVLALPNFISFLRVYFQCEGAHCAVAVSQLRQDITDLGFMKPHYQRLIFYHITTLLSYFILSGMLTANHSRRYIKISCLIAIQMFILVYNGEKAPILWYLFGLLFIFLSLGIVRNKKLISILLLVLAIGPSIAAAVGSRFADRLALGSLTVGYKVLDIYPASISYLHGKSVFDPFALWGGSSFDLPFYQWRFIHPELLYSTIIGTSVTAFWGEAYGNFGFTGVVLAAILFGLGVTVLFEAVRGVFAQSAAVAIVAWAVFRYSVFVESLFSTLVIDFYSVGVFFFLGMAFLIVRLMRGFRRRF